MKSELTIALLQYSLSWENPEANLTHFEERIFSLPNKVDLIVLPEMFATGFSMNPEKYAAQPDGKEVSEMKRWARESGSAVCGSLMVRDSGNYYNRLIWVNPSGEEFWYDKRHLFRMGEEQMHYTSGSNRIIIEFMGWKIAPFICYDIRFPVWMRRSEKFEYDLLLVVANWPERRSQHWKILTQARAIENQSFLVAVNRFGEDGNGVFHSGDSQVIAPTGEIMYLCSGLEEAGLVTINKLYLDNWRQNFPVGLDADRFEIM